MSSRGAGLSRALQAPDAFEVKRELIKFALEFPTSIFSHNQVVSVPATGDCFYDSMAVLLGLDAQVFLCMLRLWYTSDTYEHHCF